MAPKDLNISKGVNVSVEVDGAAGHATVINEGSAAALYVTLTTQAQGRFDENCFLLQAGARKEVKFLPVGCVSVPCGSTISRAQLKLLAQTTRVEHVGMYI
jgi:hypothetical protein